MRQKLTILIVITIFIPLLFSQSGEAQEYPSQEDHDWVGKHFFSVLKEFFPIEKSDLGYRSYRDLYTDVLEYSFNFNHDWKEKRISVVLRMADSVSIYDQIMTLHRKNGSEPIETIKAKLKVKERFVDDRSCREVKILYDEFYRLNLLMETSEDRAQRAKGSVNITLHPEVHTFEAIISGGNLKLVITEDKHPFVIWAKKARRSFERCQPAK